MLETPDPQTQLRLPSLTGMRFTAAFLVFVCHAAGSGIFTHPQLNDILANKVTQLGWVGVSFFFILSGFVLTWTARPDDTPRRFWRRRIAKIFPNHLVTWAAAALFLVFAGTATVLNTVPSLFLLQAWIPVQGITFSPNDPSWSLCAEVLFYLCFPWLLILVNKIRHERLWTWVGILVLVIALIPVVAQVLPDKPDFIYYEGVSWYQHWFVYLLPISRVPEFVLGIVMARIVMTGHWISISLPVALITLVPGYILLVALPQVYSLVVPTVVPLALIVASAAAADIRRQRTLFSGRTMVYLGELSFAFYLLHALVLQYGPLGTAFGRTRDIPEALGIVMISVAITLVFSWALYTAVERPVMRKWSHPRVPADNRVDVVEPRLKSS
jgi:peptidoglycan/LPS O-acetylase OafA/YrhL